MQTRVGLKRRTVEADEFESSSTGRNAAFDNGLFVGSVEKAFQILRVLSAAPGPLGLSEVVKVSGMGKSAAQRFLYTLCALEYIRQDKETKAYSITARVLDLAQSYLGADGLREKASPFLRAANLKTEVTVNLTVLDGLSVVYLMRYQGLSDISVDLSIGSKLPAFCTAPGRVILAYLEDAESAWVLEKSDIKAYTPFTVTEKSKILATLPGIRRDGYFISNQEAFVGDISVAAPVFNFAGRIVAAINMAVSTSRWSVENVREKLMPVTARVAADVSAAMGFPN